MNHFFFWLRHAVRISFVTVGVGAAPSQPSPAVPIVSWASCDEIILGLLTIPDQDVAFPYLSLCLSRTVQPRSLPIHWSVLPPPIRRAQHSYLNRVDRCINSQPLRAFELSFSRLGQFPRQVSRHLGLQRVCQHHVLVPLWKIFEAAEQAEDT